jgi:signal recognition particle GTPase
VDADVSYKVAKEFTDKVKDEAMGKGILTAVSPSQMFVKIMNDCPHRAYGWQSAGNQYLRNTYLSYW